MCYFHTNFHTISVEISVKITKIGVIFNGVEIPSYILLIFSSPSLFCLFLSPCRGPGLLLGLEGPPPINANIRCILMGFIFS